jgi:hypothetical protein
MTILSKSIATIAGAAASAIVFTSLPSYAGTITGITFNGLANNTASGNVSGNQINVTELFNNPNTITKVLSTTQSATSNIYSFIVNATNQTNFIWDSFRFNLNADNNTGDRPTFNVGSASSNFFASGIVSTQGNSQFLTFSGGTPVGIGQAVQMAFTVTVPSGFTGSSFEIDERPFGGASAAVPTPAILPAMAGFGIGLMRKRRLAKMQAA